MRFRKSIKKKGLKVKIDIQTDVDKLHKRKKKRLFFGLAVTIVVSICSLGLFIIQKDNKQGSSDKARTDLEQILNVNATKKNLATVQSNLGVQFSYNPEPIQVYGYVIDDNLTFKTYEGDDLKDVKDYAIFQVYVKQDYTNNGLPYGEYSELNINTNKNSDFFDRRRAEHGSNLSELELTIKHFAPKESTLGSKITEKERSHVKINNIEYTRVTYEETNEKYFKTTKYSEYLYTVQNGRPFAINISNITTKNRAAIDPLYDILSTIAYYPIGQVPVKNLSETSLAYGNDSISESANVPNELEDGTALTIAARNLPAVVRIGTIVCSDIDLLINGKIHSSYRQSCNAGVGSGSILSSDGYISTNGHVALIPEREGLLNRTYKDAEAGNVQTIKNYLQFLYLSGIMPESQINSMINGLSNGDKTAIDKLIASINLIPASNIRVSNKKSEYVVQLSNEPIKMNDNNGVFSFSFTGSNVQAKFIDGEYDINSNLSRLDNIKSDKSDVALLRIEKTNLPIVSLGSTESLKEYDLVTAMGFPAFVDGGIDTKKDKTVATITQGHVSTIYYDSSDQKRKLIASNVPISGGNSGGPAFNISGDQLGLNTYGDHGSCGDGNCFSYASVFRDVQDLKNLVSKNKITLNGESEFQNIWNEATELFAKGEYSKSIPLIEKSKEIYPNNYLAVSLLEKAKEGAEIESSGGLLLLVFIAGLFGSVVFAVKLVKHHKGGNSYIHQTGTQPQYPQAPQPSLQQQQPNLSQQPIAVYQGSVSQPSDANPYGPVQAYNSQPAQSQNNSQLTINNTSAAQAPPQRQENTVYPVSTTPTQPRSVDNGQQLQQPHTPGQVFRPQNPPSDGQ